MIINIVNSRGSTVTLFEEELSKYITNLSSGVDKAPRRPLGVGYPILTKYSNLLWVLSDWIPIF
jgi:hypothetical protein